MGALQLGVLFILLSWATAKYETRTIEKKFDIDMAKRRESAESTVLDDEDAAPDDEVVFLRMYANPQESLDQSRNFPVLEQPNLFKRFDPYTKRFDPFSKRFDPFFKRFDYVYKRFDNYPKRFDPLGMEFDLLTPKFNNLQKRFDPYVKRFSPFFKTYNIVKRFGNTDKKRLLYTIEQAKRNIFDPRAYQIGFGR